MRRAIALLSLVIVLLALHAARARAQGPPVQNAIGLVDYAHKRDFKVGDWARYRMKSHSELGTSDDYELTVMIAGEEDFWGDPAFWIETWVERVGERPELRASLVSYDIFTDSLATQRLMHYTRRQIGEMNEDGSPIIMLNTPGTGLLNMRHEAQLGHGFTLDTLGVDTVQVPGREYKALKVLRKEGSGVTRSVGDSTLYDELRENRTSWYSPEVPITHLVREDIESINAHKSWMIGRSGDAKALAILDRAVGSARLVAFGHNGVARVIPEPERRTIAEQVAAEKAAAKRAPTTGAPAKKPASSTTKPPGTTTKPS
jgi:hypothetical protein